MKEKIKKGHIIFNKKYRLTKRNKITKKKFNQKEAKRKKLQKINPHASISTLCLFVKGPQWTYTKSHEI